MIIMTVVNTVVIILSFKKGYLTFPLFVWYKKTKVLIRRRKNSTGDWHYERFVKRRHNAMNYKYQYQ